MTYMDSNNVFFVTETKENTVIAPFTVLGGNKNVNILRGTDFPSDCTRDTCPHTHAQPQ